MSMKNKAYAFYKELPPWAKGVVIVGGLAVSYFAVRGGWKIVKGKLDASKYQKEGKDAANQLHDLSKRGVRPTITSTQAQSFCNSLVQAFDGCGTDETAIYGVMGQMKNDADIYLLISTYGTRKYAGCGPWSMFSSDKQVSLSAAISDELDTFEKLIVNNILKGNGVTFQFT
jgi:hypothetical protein